MTENCLLTDLISMSENGYFMIKIALKDITITYNLCGMQVVQVMSSIMHARTSKIPEVNRSDLSIVFNMSKSFTKT